MKRTIAFRSRIKFEFPKINLQIISFDRYLFINRAVYIMGIIGFIMTIPQITKIWSTQSAAGVSLLSWAAYLSTASVWFAYGIIYKNKTIITLYSIWIILDAVIVYSIIKFD